MLAAAGVVGGIVVALALSPLVASQLFGIGAADPVTIAGGGRGAARGGAGGGRDSRRRVMRVDPVHPSV